jgi:HPt (histidine-containing phosphotransfer) domain-containing protein
MKEDVEKTKLANMNEHLSKPIDIDKFYITLLKYLSKKVDVIEDGKESTNISNINQLFDLKTIDYNRGLSSFGNDTVLYSKIVQKFYNDYKDKNLVNISNKEELTREIHTLKGLSATIGAIELYKISEELETSLDENRLKKLQQILDTIIKELSTIVYNEQQNHQKQSIDENRKIELFENLKTALKSQRPANCQKAIQDIEKYILEENEQITFDKIKGLVAKYQFKKALELI